MASRGGLGDHARSVEEDLYPFGRADPQLPLLRLLGIDPGERIGHTIARVPVVLLPQVHVAGRGVVHGPRLPAGPIARLRIHSGLILPEMLDRQIAPLMQSVDQPSRASPAVVVPGGIGRVIHRMHEIHPHVVQRVSLEHDLGQFEIP